ncbi:MAG: DUF4166 domain-containing protein [Xanthomonadales bacterium]|nr:DUF4166 domain-containing protein [Xanthomonadales bacterium]
MDTLRALFPSLLGAQWTALAEPVKHMHGDAPRVLARGRADVDGAPHLPARCLRRLFGLPEPGPQQALTVTIQRDGCRETWSRQFASGPMVSTLDRSRNGERLHERLGPLTFVFELQADGAAINLQLRGARMLGLPLPRALCGRVDSRSAAQAGRYTFAIDVKLPLLGQLVAYRGWLEIVDE